MQVESVPEKLLKEASIDFNPARVEIKGYEDMEVSLESFVKKYKGLVATEETIKEVKATRASLNKLKKLLDDKRKEVKREASKPIKDFEDKIKRLVSVIDTVNSDIDSSIKSLEDKQRMQRELEVKALIEEMAPNYDVDPAEVEIKSSWLNKTTSKKKLLDEIAGTMHDINRQKEKQATERKLIELACKEQGLEPYGFFQMLEGVLDVNIVIKEIERAGKEKRDRAELAKRKQEAELAEQRAKLADVSGKQIDKETGAVMVSKQVVSFKLKGTKEALDEVARFIVQSEVEVLEASERTEVIEEA